MIRRFAIALGAVTALGATAVSAEEDYVPSGNPPPPQPMAGFKFPTEAEQYDINKLAGNVEAANFTGGFK